MSPTIPIHHLEAEGLTSRTNNLALNVVSAEQGEVVRDLAGSKVTLGGSVLATAVGNIRNGSVAVLLGVGGEDDLLAARVLEDGGLDAHLGPHARVDSRAAELVVEVVVDVDGAVADRGVAAVDVLPVVVGVGDVQLAFVVGLRVDVADQGGLEVVVDVAVGDGDVVGAPGDIQETVVVVLARVKVGAQVNVIDPDVGGRLDTDGIAVGLLDLGDGQVANDDVLDTLDVQTDAGELGALLANNGLVRLDTDFLAARNRALDDDVELAVRLSGFGELGQRRHGGRGATVAAGCTAIGAGVTDGARLGDKRTLRDGAECLFLGRRSGGSRSQADEGEIEDVGELHLDGTMEYNEDKNCKFDELQKPVLEKRMILFSKSDTRR